MTDSTVQKSSRRQFIFASSAISTIPLAIMVNAGCGSTQSTTAPVAEDQPNENVSATTNNVDAGDVMQIQYLEIVAKDVDSVCAMYARTHGVTFSEPDPTLGSARTAKLASGGMLGVRAPMHDGEKPVVRPYVLVKEIEAAVKAAESAGAQIAVPPMKLGTHGTCAIIIHNGIESGLWQI